MPETLLRTKLFVPPRRPNLVRRPHLAQALNQGVQLGHKLTLVSAPAGFGKTTLISEWAHNLQFKIDDLRSSTDDLRRDNINSIANRVAWLSLDERDSDPTHFLTYFVAALQNVAPTVGERALTLLQSAQSPPDETFLTLLLNEITSIPDSFVLVLDDYHLLDARAAAAPDVHDALTFLLEHQPPQMHLVMVTREDPPLPLARLRARGQLTELRAADLRFTSTEAAEFLNEMMALNLSAADIAALEARTEGWIAGLQLAALALQGLAKPGTKSAPAGQDTADFIQSFGGSHHFVLDYLLEEVLQQQPESVQTFLLRTSILDRLCGPLCDAVCTLGKADTSAETAVSHQEARRPPPPAASGQETLAYLERANLFIVPLDDERRWYRYHHLFADLLRQRLRQSAARSSGDAERFVNKLHVRASRWYEENGLWLEAFQHAAAADEVERAARLLEGEGMPLQFRGAMTPVWNWLASLETAVLNARPALWVTYASALTMLGQPIDSVEEKLAAAETALQDAGQDDKTRDLIGHIAAIRAMLAIPRNQAEIMMRQSRRALEFLHPDNLPVRTTASWTLGLAYHLQGDRGAASQAYSEAISTSQATENLMITLAVTTSLGQLQQSENQLHLAATSYRRSLELAGEPPLPAACEAHLGLARLYYEWNELEPAREHARQCAQLAPQIKTIDTPASCEVFFARLKLAQGDIAGAIHHLDKAVHFLRRHNFQQLIPDVAAVQVVAFLRQGKLTTAAELAQTHKIPLSQARVLLVQGNPDRALAVLEPYREQVESRGWQDEQLKVLVLRAIALRADDKKEEAMQCLKKALTLAEPGGFIRLFVDEGPPMVRLLLEALSHKIKPDYVRRLLSVFPDVAPEQVAPLSEQASKSKWVETLSEREVEVLQLIAAGLTNQEIADRLVLALNTVKVHTRNINGKLGVSSRTKAVARARALGILPSD